jgi:nucleotide-binding universal stress UspA family protein
MYHSILVPLDRSPFAEHALPMARAIARRARTELQLTLVHCLPAAAVLEGGTLFYDGSLDAEVKRHDRVYLDWLVQRLGSLQVSAKPVLLDGQVVEALRAHITSSQADLVVMTTHGRGPFGRFWLGSVADELVRRSPVPILLVRPHEEAADLGREPVVPHILVPLDGTPLAEQILTPAAELARMLGAECTLLRVVKPLLPLAQRQVSGSLEPFAEALGARLGALHAKLHEAAEDYLEQVARRMRSGSLRVWTRVVHDEHPATAILHEAERLGSGIVALETHGRRGLTRVFLGSVADKVLRGSPLPLLLHRPQGQG